MVRRERPHPGATLDAFEIRVGYRYPALPHQHPDGAARVPGNLATAGTIRAQLINVLGRLVVGSARTLILHLPTGWPWEAAWEQMAIGARHGQRGLNHPPRPAQARPEHNVEINGRPDLTSSCPHAGQRRERRPRLSAATRRCILAE